MSIYSCKEFGLCLKEKRKSLGYTQTFLSEFSGLSVSFISDIENGKETAEFGKVLILANLLGLDFVLKERG